jgi:Arabinose-binding domain of AraC transcription regulator, N-term
MVRRAKVSTGDLFLTCDGVATRLAMRELKNAKINPGPLLAKAGISLLKLGEEPKRVNAESQIRFLEIAAEALGDTALGLHLAQHFDLREGGMLYYVLAASQNLGEAIRNLARYLAVANESLRVGVSERAKTTVLTVNYRTPRAHRPTVRGICLRSRSARFPRIDRQKCLPKSCYLYSRSQHQ